MVSENICRPIIAHLLYTCDDRETHILTPPQLRVDRHTAVVRGVCHETSDDSVHTLIHCCDMLCGSVYTMSASAGDSMVTVVLH